MENDSPLEDNIFEQNRGFFEFVKESGEVRAAVVVAVCSNEYDRYFELTSDQIRYGDLILLPLNPEIPLDSLPSALLESLASDQGKFTILVFAGENDPSTFQI